MCPTTFCTKDTRFFCIIIYKIDFILKKRPSFNYKHILSRIHRTFKSFKMKKKSSTLGINKTSESPPMLRHQVHPTYDTYSTIDSRMRHTVNAGPPNQFDRGAGYRSSLQNVHSVGLSTMVTYKLNFSLHTLNNINSSPRVTVMDSSETIAIEILCKMDSKQHR